ncbi:hypothetical protein CEXT_262851 [Caerostris extrusa]|uniref:Uncharacterized protein n=1 Tax=Caerostris extrusa TaxID=172846 RepID=A0AAV4Q2Q8_CAEEX|nr:hypothetical protein CEXT_262851 [Caerostris extrusa]
MKGPLARARCDARPDPINPSNGFWANNHRWPPITWGARGGLVSKRRTPLSEFNWDNPSNGIREWVHIGIQQKGSNKYGHCSKETSLPPCQKGHEGGCIGGGLLI